MYLHFSILLLISSFLCLSANVFHLDLNGEDWIVSGKHDDEEISVTATVPGGIYTDLMNSGNIDDIFAEKNDEKYVWVSLTDWTYVKSFTVAADTLLVNENINLVFEGIDTFSTIKINNNTIGTTENMFVRYIFPVVKDYLIVGSNTIEVKFQSPVLKAAALSKTQNYIIPPECPPNESHGACHANQIRKMQSSFSWDWGPSFPSVGIFKNVYLESYSNTVIRYIITEPQTKPDDDFWTVPLTLYFSNNSKELIEGNLEVLLFLPDGTLLAASNSSDISVGPNEFREFVYKPEPLQIFSKHAMLWWPNGYGPQNLYTTRLTLTSSDGDIATIETKFGLRTVELIQEQIMNGSTFYFKINGVPMFAKGANEIPINILPELGMNSVARRNVLQTAKDCNMNMLRVWGGGVYESDEFYSLADEFGILIWQDFMFACAMYPTTPDFLQTVVEEVRHQIKRLSRHSSIAVWAGNNENEAALMQNWYSIKPENLELYKKDYIKLYINTIKSELSRILRAPIFLTSSPTNGKKSDAEGYLSANPGDSKFGDVHYYNYILDGWDAKTFPIPRFASEYGYQSMPSIESWLTTTQNLSSDFIDHRQHHPGGGPENDALISYQLTVPDKTSENYYPTYIYYSQIVQAMSIKTETEHYRRFMKRYNDLDEGGTMGALYWQLNDVWVAPTWSGMDFTGRWKMLQYFSKDFFAPIIVSPEIDDEEGTLSVYIVTDAIPAFSEPISTVVLIQIYNFDNAKRPVLTQPIGTFAVPGVSINAGSVNLEETLQKSGCGKGQVARNNCFVVVQLVDVKSVKLLAPTNYMFLGKLKECNIQPANVEINSVTLSDEAANVFNVVVSMDAMAFFIWLDSHQIHGRFSKNGWIQREQGNETIQFTTFDANITAAVLQAALTVTHLKDPIHQG